jgi:hypothetical protein
MNLAILFQHYPNFNKVNHFTKLLHDISHVMNEDGANSFVINCNIIYLSTTHSPPPPIGISFDKQIPSFVRK